MNYKEHYIIIGLVSIILNAGMFFAIYNISASLETINFSMGIIAENILDSKVHSKKSEETLPSQVHSEISKIPDHKKREQFLYCKSLCKTSGYNYRSILIDLNSYNPYANDCYCGHRSSLNAAPYFQINDDYKWYDVVPR